MPRLRIPSQYIGGLKELLALNDPTVLQLTEVLENAPPTLDPDDFQAFVSENFGERVPLSPAGISVLLSLRLLQLRLDLDTLQLMELVSEAMDEGEHEELKIPEEDRGPFIDRVVRLLSIGSLLYPTKAASLIQAHEYLFAHARIVTDIRPVFGSDVTRKPAATAIIHTLQLTCHHEDDVKHYYIAMDRSDVELLKDVLDRAILKADNLGAFLKDSGMTSIWE
ncbi:MAG: hypothetical protein V1792_11485 [Pseudomonadota bacterium]